MLVVILVLMVFGLLAFSLITPQSGDPSND